MSATRCASSSWCRGRRVAGPRGRRLRRLERGPAAAVLADEAVLLQRGQDGVEVFLLAPHRLGHLGNRDAGARAHELERLLRPRAAAARPPAPSARAAARPTAGGAAAAAPGGAPGRRPAACAGAVGRPPAADAVERGSGRLEAVIFVNERAKLLQPRVDLTLLLFQEICHRLALYTDRLTRPSRQPSCRADYLERGCASAGPGRGVRRPGAAPRPAAQRPFS